MIDVPAIIKNKLNNIIYIITVFGKKKQSRIVFITWHYIAVLYI